MFPLCFIVYLIIVFTFEPDWNALSFCFFFFLLAAHCCLPCGQAPHATREVTLWSARCTHSSHQHLTSLPSVCYWLQLEHLQPAQTSLHQGRADWIPLREAGRATTLIQIQIQCVITFVSCCFVSAESLLWIRRMPWEMISSLFPCVFCFPRPPYVEDDNQTEKHHFSVMSNQACDINLAYDRTGNEHCSCIIEPVSVTGYLLEQHYIKGSQTGIHLYNARKCFQVISQCQCLSESSHISAMFKALNFI